MGSEALSLTLTAATLVGGTLSTYLYDRSTPLWWRICAGACCGLAALGLAAFALAARFGLTMPVVAVAAIAVASPAALLFSQTYRRRVQADLAAAVRPPRWLSTRPDGRTARRASLCVATAIFLWHVADQAMFVRTDGIYTGMRHNIGDLPFHLSVTNRFLQGGNFPPEHPSYAGVGFTYPFLTDFIGAVFVRAGIPVEEVIVWSTWLLCLTTAALLYSWTLEITASRTAAWLAPILALCSGGLGWWRFFTELWRSDAAAWTVLSRLPHDYTISNDGEFRWGNLVTTLLVTQRGLLLGLPMALIVFQLWWQATADDKAEDHRPRMIAAGVIAGMLPLIHAHTFAVVLGVAACLALLSHARWRWLPFFMWSMAIGLPQVWWLAQSSGVQGGSFIAWAVGWDRGDQNAVLFWLKNTGLLIPILVVALSWPVEPPIVPRPLRRFYLPFVLCFIVPNLFRLSPWIWDNIKLLLYWFVASVPLVALALARLAQGSRWRAGVTAVLVAALTLSGALDLWRVASGAFRSRLFDRDGIEFAALVERQTDPRSLILHAPMPNHPVALTGRRSLMGYPGHVWSHGLDPGPREADIKRMYSGGPGAETLLRRYQIDYVVVGPSERFQMPTNEAFFERYERAGQAGDYHLYRVAAHRQN